MAARIEVDTAADLNNLRKTLLILGGGVAISGIIYLFLKTRSGRNNMSNHIEEPDHDLPVQEDEEPAKKKVLILGLEGAGKSSILLGLQMNANKMSEDTVPPTPTEGFHVVCVQTGVTELNMWEIGGAEKMRKYWSNFTQDTDILAYVVDSTSDEDSLKFSGEELTKVLQDDKLDGIPLVILVNKQDLPEAKTTEEVRNGLQLPLTVLENREISTIPIQVPFQRPSEGLTSLEALLIAHDL